MTEKYPDFLRRFPVQGRVVGRKKLAPSFYFPNFTSRACRGFSTQKALKRGGRGGRHRQNIYLSVYINSKRLEFCCTPVASPRARVPQSLPLTAAPEVFGLHDNASITRAQSDTVQLLKTMVLTESSGGGTGGSDKEETISAVAADILSKVRSKLLIRASETKSLP